MLFTILWLFSHNAKMMRAVVSDETQNALLAANSKQWRMIMARLYPSFQI